MSENTIPAPRLMVGDTIFRPSAEPSDLVPECPDCKGSKRWQVTTPAGSTFEVNCYRCGDKYVDRDVLPKIGRALYKPVVYELKISTVEITLGVKYGKPGGVEYRASANGGGYYVFDDETAISDRAEAERRAQEMANQENAKLGQNAEAIRSGSYLNLTIEHALYKAAKSAIFDGFWSYRSLRENVEACVYGDEETRNGDEYSDASEACEGLRAELEFDKKHRGHTLTRQFEAILLRARKEFPAEMFAEFPAITLESIDRELGLEVEGGEQ